MTLVLMALTLMAFAGIYAALLAMLGAHAGSLGSALSGVRPQAGGTTVAASRRFSRA
jgi:hypothetical protein